MGRILSDADELRLLVKTTERELRRENAKLWAAYLADFARSLDEPDYIMSQCRKPSHGAQPAAALQDLDEL